MTKAIPIYEAFEADRRPTRQEDIDAYGGAARGGNAVCWLPDYTDSDSVLANDMVRRLGSLYIANQNTSQTPNTRLLGDPIFGFDDSIIWSSQTQVGYVATGTAYNFNRYVELRKIRVYLSDTSGLTDYHWAVSDKHGNLIVYQKLETPGSVGWLEIDVRNTLIAPAEELHIYLEAENYGSPQTPWSYIWQSTTTPIPAAGYFYHDIDAGLLQIAKEDSTATDRSSDLSAMLVGSTILLSESSASTRYVDYRININPVDMGVYYEYTDCELLDFGSNIRKNRSCTVEGNPAPGGNSEWVENIGYWSSYIPSDYSGRGLVIASPGADPIINLNAYGVDLQYVPVETQSDWDLIL